MSYLSKLIDRATNTKLHLESNTIGRYSISPQHGQNCFVYHIYKRDVQYNTEHIVTLRISSDTKKITISYTGGKISKKELKEVKDILTETYPKYWKITLETFYI